MTDKELLDLCESELRQYLESEISPDELLWRIEVHKLHHASMTGQKISTPKKIKVDFIFERSV